MNSIGVCRFIAQCAKLRVAGALAAVLCSCCTILAADCDTSLSAQERLTRFKQLDSEAESAMQQKRFETAVRLYREAVCLFPNTARGYYGLGVAEAAAGDLLKARDDLRTADHLEPTTGMPLLMQARVNFALKDMDALKSNLREAADRFPNDAQLHTTFARFLAERNLFVLALAEAMRSQQVSNDWNSNVQLAVLENAAGAYDDAIQNALSVEQNHDVPEQGRAAAAGIAGLSYESLQQTESAIRYLQEAIQLDPSQVNSYLALADAFEHAQKYPNAVNVLRQAQANLPASPAILLPLGDDLIRAEHYKEGIELLQELLRKAPDTPDAYVSIADAARKMGDASQEVAALRQLMRYKPDYPMIHVLIARAMLNEEKVDNTAVLNELALAARSAPKDPDVFLMRGKVYLTLAQYNYALAALRRSIELRPTDPAAYYQLAKVYQKLGKPGEAKEQFEKVKFLEASAK